MRINHAGISFEHDNPALWAIVDKHRNDYRHKIAHSNILPNKKTTEDRAGAVEGRVGDRAVVNHIAQLRQLMESVEKVLDF